MAKSQLGYTESTRNFIYANEDDEQNDRFLVSDTTLTGADVTFADAEDGVLYFAILTVTDKDGGVWNSLETSSGSFFAFATGPALPPPSEDDALYAAVFTDVSETNVAFHVRLVSGDPAATDRAELQFSTSLAAGEDGWKALFVFNPGSLLLTPTSVSDKSVTLKTTMESARQTILSTSDGIDIGIVYAAEPTDSERFYRIYQTKP